MKLYDQYKKSWTSVSIAQNINFWTIDSPNFIMFIYIICFDDWSNNFIKPMVALNHVILFWSCIFSSIYGTWSKRTHLHFMKFWSKGPIFGQNGPTPKIDLYFLVKKEPTYFWGISRVRIMPIIQPQKITVQNKSILWIKLKKSFWPFSEFLKKFWPIKGAIQGLSSLYIWRISFFT